MQIKGNYDGLVEEIEESYKGKHQNLDDYYEDKSKEINDIFDLKIKKLKAKQKKKLATELEIIEKKLLNEAKQTEQRKVQKFREDLILNVVKDISADAESIINSDVYFKYLKDHIPQKDITTIETGSKKYAEILKKKLGFKKVKVVKGISGVKAISKDFLFDFTIKSIVSANADKIQEVVAKGLFDGG